VIVVYEVKLSGSYYDMGLRIGKMLEKDKGLLPKFSKEKVEKGMEYEKEVRTYTPELLLLNYWKSFKELLMEVV
jgi:hypothetical protein